MSPVLLLLSLALANPSPALVPEGAMRRGADGAVRFLRLPPGAALPGVSTELRAEEKVRALLRRHGDALGISDDTGELELERARRAARGELLSYGQRVSGVPVYGAVLHARFDADGTLRALASTLQRDVRVDPRPRLSGGEAAERARRYLEERAAQSLGARARVLELVVLRAGTARGVPGRDHLTYRIEVTAAAEREIAFIDAHSGKLVERYSLDPRALRREVYRGQISAETLLWSDPEAIPTGLEPEIDDILAFTEDTYRFYENISGGERLSFDGEDAPMLIVYAPDGELYRNEDEPLCPGNAMWNGVSINICENMGLDDVIAHEWTHAYSDVLVYGWQPGALEESYADIFGETIDRVNRGGIEDPEDIPRTDDNCSVLGTVLHPRVRIAAPAELEGVHEARGASFGRQLDPATPLTGDVALARDDIGTVDDACEPIVNTDEVSGRIALVRRGTCEFDDKVRRARDAGALAVIVFNAEGDELVSMGGSDQVDVSAVFVGQTLGEAMAREPVASVRVSLEVEPPDPGADPSIRWLIGESSAGGPIVRDMWMPACLGGPGRISDAEYECSEADGGGVHTNSTVPSHAFALLVDGGRYNGRSVTGLGLTKAAHVYWRARAYESAFMQFADHADALEAACDELVGVDLPSLVELAPSGETIAEADCDQVRAAIDAVELRGEPSQCEFEPLLAPAAPVVCGSSKTLFFDDFAAAEDWVVSHDGVNAEFTPRDWVVTAGLPDGRPGSAYFGEAADLGDCVPGRGDESGVLYLTSPEISLPASATDPRLTFEHYVATEPHFDGGNVRIRVNGGAWRLVAAESYTFNGYSGQLATSAQGNTNPMAGSPAFSGTNQGSMRGSWGQSQVKLANYARPGDVVEIQFRLGVDGCGGVDGWYVDDVRVLSCAEGNDGDDGGCSAAGGLGSAVASVLLLVLGRRRRRA